MNYIFLADGFETVEALAVVDMLRRASIPIQTVSIGETNEVVTAHKIRMMTDVSLADINLLEIDMMILPGGMPGTKNLAACEPLMEMMNVHAGKGGLVAAICAAPSVLGKHGLLAGKRACCYPGFEEELEGAIVTKREVEWDGNIITSRGMGTVIPFAAKIIEALDSKMKADEVLKSIQWNTSDK